MDSYHKLMLAVAVLIPVLFAISVHEAGHGFAARYFGDPTAAEEGRLSINPLRHIDPLGTILLPLVAYFAIGMPFGYAKPVPVDFDKLRKPRAHAAYVALAGPMANFAMGVLWTGLWLALVQVHMFKGFLAEMLQAGMWVNAAMFVFNMIPIPPLDGGRIMTSLLPRRVAQQFARIEVYDIFVFIAFMVLMYFHVLDDFLLKAMHLINRQFISIATFFIRLI